MIALVEGVDEEFPVHLLIVHVAVVEVIAVELPEREVGAEAVEPRLDVEVARAIGRGRRQHPDHAVLLGQRQWREARALGADAGEGGCLLGDPAQHPVGAVGPAVIGAGERAGAAAALRDLGAAMAAGVEESAQLAVPATHGEDRHPGVVLGAVGAGLGPIAGKAHDQRTLPDEYVLLALVSLRACERRHLVAPRRLGHARGFGVEVVQQRLEDLDLGGAVHAWSSQGLGVAGIVVPAVAAAPALCLRQW